MFVVYELRFAQRGARLLELLQLQVVPHRQVSLEVDCNLHQECKVVVELAALWPLLRWHLRLQEVLAPDNQYVGLFLQVVEYYFDLNF